MSTGLEALQKNLGVAPTSLGNDLTKKGTTQPTTTPQGGALSALQASLAGTTPVSPQERSKQAVSIVKDTKSALAGFNDQVKRKAFSFNAGLLESVGTLLSGAQWLGDRVVGDKLTQSYSDENMKRDMEETDLLLKQYRQYRDSGQTKLAETVKSRLSEKVNAPFQYNAYSDTDSVFKRSKDKTAEWAQVLRDEAGITQDNQTFVEKVFEGGGSSAVYFVPAVGIARGASVLSLVSPRIAMLFGGSASAGLEAMSEAGGVYDELKKSGAKPQEAVDASMRSFLANSILLTISNHIGFMNPEVTGVLKKALLSAPVEGLQEAVQQMIQNNETGRPISEGVAEAGSIGAIIGTVMGGGADLVTQRPASQKAGGLPDAKNTTPESESEAMRALRQKIAEVPAIDQQRAIEGTHTSQAISEKATVPTPTEGKVGTDNVGALPTGEVKIDIPQTETPALAEKVQAQEDQLTEIAGKVENVEELMKKINESQVDLEDVVQFHGTQAKDFAQALKDGTVRASEDGVVGSGFYLTTTPNNAEYFGKQVFDPKENARVETDAKPDIFAFDLRGLKIKRLDFGKQEFYDFLKERETNVEDYKDTLNAQGYDGLNLVGRGETVIFDPSKLKQFDFNPLLKKTPPVKEVVKEVQEKAKKAKKETPKTETPKEETAVVSEKKKGEKKVVKTPVENKSDIEGLKEQIGELENKIDELTLETQPAPKEGESKTQTDVQGEKVNRFTGKPQEEKTPRVQGQLKPELTKSQLLTLLKYSPEMKENPYLTVENVTEEEVSNKIREREDRVGYSGVPVEERIALNSQRKLAQEGEARKLTWKGTKGKFSIMPEALGLVGKNLVVGERIKVTPELLKKGDGQEMRVMQNGKAYASTDDFADMQDVGTTKDISKNTKLLYKEAKKYKTAEEFVKSQGTPIYRGQSNAGVNLQQNIGDAMPELGGGKFFSTEKQLADAFGENTIERLSSKKNTVTKQETIKLQKMATKQVESDISMQIESDPVIEDMALGRPKAFAEYTGKPVVEVQHLLGRQGGEVVYYEQFDKNTIKTSSQLTDIWNEVNKKTLEPLQKERDGSKHASLGVYVDKTETFLGHPEQVSPIQFPELVSLLKELMGNVPFIRKYTKANGMFYARGNGEIGLHPDLFKKENLGQLQKTLAHEIGHLVDYLPEGIMQRGNLMGLLNTLKGFNKEFFAEAGASRTDAEVREQMYKLSKMWRPFDEDAVSASHLAYRKSAPEIYADFISALFNAPRLTEETAPTAWNIFFQQLDKKPAVKQAYFELQDTLRNGDMVANRRSATKEMFKVTEQEARERQIQKELEQEAKEKSLWFKFKTQAVDINEVIREKVKEAEKNGTKLNPDDNPLYYLEERNYLGGKIKNEVDDKFNHIYEQLQKDELSWEDLGELMMYERILKGDRQDVANPLGYQPDFVRELMDVYEDVGSVTQDTEKYQQGTSDMRATLGDEKYSRLQELARQYRENLKSFFVQGREEGIYSESLEQIFNENDFYVPFKGAKYSGTRSTFAVKQKKGTLGNIENPANTGIEKAVSIMRAIERNKVTRKTMEFLTTNFAEDVTQAKLDQNGYPIDPNGMDGQYLVTYMQDGKVKGYYVDKYIHDSVKNNTVAESNLMISSLRFWNSGLFRPLFITFNLGFQSFNAIRDFSRFWKNVPDMTVAKAFMHYKDALRESKIRAFGLPANPSARDLEAYESVKRMEQEQILSVTYNDIIKGEDIEEAQIDRIMQDVGVREAKTTRLGKLGDKVGITKNTVVIKQVNQILEFIEKIGNLVESIPKIAGVHALEGKMHPREMRSFVRKYVGSPDFQAGGKWKKHTNEIFLFSNAIMQGVRADYEIATQPKSRGAFWMKTAQANLVPKMLMLMALQGYFGEYLKELFNKVSEYDLTNYTVIPLGIDQNGKAVYVRIPADETGKMISGLFWKATGVTQDPSKLGDFQTYMDMVNYAGGQAPSLSPVAELGLLTIPQFVTGNNPYDFFRGRQILTDEQQRAGGMERIKPFLAYMFENLGGSVFMKLYSNETVPANPTLGEKVMKFPLLGNVAGRFVRFSDYGETEKIRKLTDELRSDQAREGIANRAVVFDYVGKSYDKPYGEVQKLKQDMIKEIYGGIPKTPEDRRQAKTYEKRFDTLRLRGTTDAKVDALLVAQSNEEKAMLLKEYQQTMTPEKFADLKRFIIQYRVVSSDVFQRFYRGDN